jgi:hypothetical protein
MTVRRPSGVRKQAASIGVPATTAALRTPK